MRTKQIALAQVIIEDLSLLQLGSTLEDINIKLGALSAAIASMVVHYPGDQDTILKAQVAIMRQLKEDIIQAQISKSRQRINTEEDTREMLRKIGILKSS